MRFDDVAPVLPGSRPVARSRWEALARLGVVAVWRTVKRRECGFCYGVGQEADLEPGPGGEWVGYVGPCPDCDGVGAVEDRRMRPIWTVVDDLGSVNHCHGPREILSVVRTLQIRADRRALCSCDDVECSCLWPHPVGTRVRVWPGERPGRSLLAVTASTAVILGGHTPGVFVHPLSDEGPGGFYALTHCDYEPSSGSGPVLCRCGRTVTGIGSLCLVCADASGDSDDWARACGRDPAQGKCDCARDCEERPPPAPPRRPAPADVEGVPRG